ncbi:response regulator [Sphingomonas sp.]|uniref:response regulator n=1 Tax=Sphingomonas sp. TaxID=28214 RepID=UPI003AFF7A6E
MTDAAIQRVLVVDDDAELSELIAGFLRDHHYEVETAADAARMDAALARARFDCVILDLMMPGEDGLSALRRLRARARTPVIMLSAMGDDVDRIVGLEVGADDYLAKPCNPRELLARVRALLRRAAEGGGEVAATPRRRFGDWSLDLVERTLARAGQPAAQLTDAEFRILTAFLDRAQRVLSRDTLIELAKGSDADVFDRAIDVTISRLRKKLGPGDPIRTIRNEGYMFTVRPEG